MSADGLSSRVCLHAPAFRPFPVGAIGPRGWLADQLNIQLQGLSGHLDRFWPDIQDSAWIGGQAVNNAMAVKAGPLWWRLTGEEKDRDSARTMMAKLDAHHGMVTGVFSGDECLAGKSPVQGTELCAVVEYM